MPGVVAGLGQPTLAHLIFRLPFAIRARIVCGTPADYPFRKPGGRIAPTEVLVRLVAASVFKTAGLSVNRSAGGFDSHALPPFFALPFPPTPSFTVDKIQIIGIGDDGL